ncbi:MAG TPA: META domain-containing protein [Candidatus Limnocylindrales bacterium]|nr:META domain-containing protein [Candidatus Limnocylindrales bacterium]
MPRSLAPVRLVALIVLLAIVGAISGCGSDGPPTGSAPGSPPDGPLPALAGTAWIVISVNGRSPIAGAVPTIVFDAARASGFGGCNQFGGSYQFDATSGRFVVHEIAATAMGCLQAGVGDFETAFMTALGGSTQAGLDPTGQLILSGPAARIVLVTLEHPGAGG